MTGFRCSKFRWDCSMNGCYHDSLPDWEDICTTVFPRGIYPTDIDGMVEINGHILFIEQKGPGVAIDTGQRLAMRHLANLSPKVTVVFMRPGKASDLEVLIYHRDHEATGFRPCTRDDFLTWLRGWAERADTQKTPQAGPGPRPLRPAEPAPTSATAPGKGRAGVGLHSLPPAAAVEGSGGGSAP